MKRTFSYMHVGASADWWWIQVQHSHGQIRLCIRAHACFHVEAALLPAGRRPIHSGCATDPRTLTAPRLCQVQLSLSLSLPPLSFLPPQSPTPLSPPLTLPWSWQLGPSSALTTLPELTTVIILYWTQWSLKVIPTSLPVEVNRCVDVRLRPKGYAGVRQNP